MPDINAAFSAVSSIAEKTSLGNVVNNITSGVKGFADAAKSAYGTASLKVSSLFETKDFSKPLGKSKDDSPEKAKANVSKYVGALTYPADMGYYTVFSFIQYNKKEVTAVATDKNSVTIILPLPANLSESFNVQYETPSLGPVAGAATEGILSAMRNNDATGAITALSKGETYAEAGVAGGLGFLKKAPIIGETAAAIGSMALGVAPNPHLAVLFTNLGLRTHKFSYKFAPRSEAELKRIKNIIYNLKHKMLPGMSGHDMLFNFPDVVDIKFVTGKGQAPYTIKRCVMESLDVNYSPGGSPAFFKTGDPVMVELSMSFKEMSPYTRDDIPVVK
jgi:hypothetical protein